MLFYGKNEFDGIIMRDEKYAHNDKYLLSALCKGDREAFDCIFRKYYVDVVMFCGRFMNRIEDSEDIAQSIFLHIWDMREVLPVITNFKSYLLKSAQNMCINELHRREKERRYSSEQLVRIQPYVLGEDINKMLFYSELKKLIASAEASLDKKEWDVWRLSRHEGLKYSEIAAILGISVRAVEDRMQRAKRHFLKILDQYWAIATLFLTFLQT